MARHDLQRARRDPAQGASGRGGPGLTLGIRKGPRTVSRLELETGIGWKKRGKENMMGGARALGMVPQVWRPVCQSWQLF